MRLTVREIALLVAMVAGSGIVALVYGLIVGSGLYWDTVVHNVLQLPYPVTYGYIASAVLTGGFVVGIIGWTRIRPPSPEIALLLFLNLTLFFSSLGDLIFKGSAQHFI
jgi:hypothetical protein